MRKYTELSQPQIIPVRTDVKHVHSVKVPTQETQSAVDQPGKDNGQARTDCECATQETQSALDQTRQGKCQHVQSVSAQTQETQSALDQSGRENGQARMGLQTNKHTERSQPQIKPARKMSMTYWLQTRKHMKLSLRSTQ